MSDQLSTVPEGLGSEEDFGHQTDINLSETTSTGVQDVGSGALGSDVTNNADPMNSGMNQDPSDSTKPSKPKPSGSREEKLLQEFEPLVHETYTDSGGICWALWSPTPASNKRLDRILSPEFTQLVACSVQQRTGEVVALDSIKRIQTVLAGRALLNPRTVSPVDENELINLIDAVLKEKNSLTLTYPNLMSELIKEALKTGLPLNRIPRGSVQLGRELRKIENDLRKAGIKLKFDRISKERMVIFSRLNDSGMSVTSLSPDLSSVNSLASIGVSSPANDSDSEKERWEKIVKNATEKIHENRT